MLIECKKGSTIDCGYCGVCFINTEEIAALLPHVVGDRSEGTQVTLKSGQQILIWGGPEEIQGKINKATEEAKGGDA